MAKAANKNEGAIGYVDGVLGELTEQAPKALIVGEPKAVHRARVATRRMGAALEVCSPLVAKGPMKLMTRALRRIRKSVQTLRDLDVMQDHLAEFEKAGAHPIACIRLRERMAQERLLSQQQIATDARVEKWLGRVGYWMAVRGTLNGKTDEMRGLIVQALNEQFQNFAVQAQRLSDGLAEGKREGGDVEPHALRIAGKSLRYTLEMAQAQQLGVHDQSLKLFKQMQDALGIWHDYHVLTQQILRGCLEEMQAVHYRRDEDELMLLGVRIVRESAKELGDFARLWKKNGTTLTDQIQGIVKAAQISPETPALPPEVVEPPQPPQASVP